LTNGGGAMDKRKSIPIRVLIVDSREEYIITLTNRLRTFGIAADRTNSGRQAVRMARKLYYDLIFLEQGMPDSNEYKVIPLLRSIYKKKDTVIYIVTSDTAEEKIDYDKEIKVDGVCNTNLGVNEITHILEEHFQHKFRGLLMEDGEKENVGKRENFEFDLEELPCMIKELGGKLAGKDKPKYSALFKNALKDIDRILSLIQKNDVRAKPSRLHKEINNLRSFFIDIGELDLLKQSYLMETLLKQGDISFVEWYLPVYANHIKSFKRKLEYFMRIFEIEEQNAENLGSNCSNFLSEKEYEQCLLNTIYYIKISDYDSIIEELVKLIHLGNQGLKEELKKALEDVLEFEYEKALERIINVKSIAHINTEATMPKKPDETI
jgi:CheY-like chemotaxis protein